MRLCAAVPVNSATARNGSRASAEAGSTLPPRPLASRNAPFRRRGSWRCGRDKRARAGPRFTSPALRSTSPLAGEVDERSSPRGRLRRDPPPSGEGEQGRPPLRHRARILGAARAVAAELVEPMAEIDIVAAEPALGQHRGDARRPARPRPRAAASTTMRASRGGSGSARSLRPSSVMRPSRIDARRARRAARAPRSSAAGGGGSRKASVPGSARAPLRQIEHEAPTDRRTEFPAAYRARASRSAARPTAGSRRPARCGRRGRGAGRRRRATRARFRAASGRRRARSAARAPARCR